MVDALDGEACRSEAVGELVGAIERRGDPVDVELAVAFVHGDREQPTGPEHATERFERVAERRAR